MATHMRRLTANTGEQTSLSFEPHSREVLLNPHLLSASLPLCTQPQPWASCWTRVVERTRFFFRSLTRRYAVARLRTETYRSVADVAVALGVGRTSTHDSQDESTHSAARPPETVPSSAPSPIAGPRSRPDPQNHHTQFSLSQRADPSIPRDAKKASLRCCRHSSRRLSLLPFPTKLIIREA